MRAKQLESTPDGLVHLQLPKGVLLILTVEQYVEALNRGKAYRRALLRARYHERTLAKHEAGRLAWIAKE